MTRILTQKEKQILKEKLNFPPNEGETLSLLDDKVFRIFMRRNQQFLARIINIVTDISYIDLIENMTLIDADIPEEKIYTHYNTQDIVVSLKNTTINVELSSNKYRNKRKNERTAHKYAGNQYINGENYEGEVYIFYQICLEDYTIFDNDLLINKVYMINASSGKYEIETDEFVKFHVNLKKLEKLCYNESNKYFKFLKLTNIKELEELSKGDEVLMNSLNDLKNLSKDSYLISELEEQKLDEYCRRLALKDAKEDGLSEGEKIGFDKGEKVGFDKGEKSKQIEIAKKMLDKCSNKEFIHECTGLSFSEIDGLN